VITLQYNMLDRTLEEGIAHAAEMNIGVVVMARWGRATGRQQRRIGRPDPNVQRVPELALRLRLLAKSSCYRSRCRA